MAQKLNIYQMYIDNGCKFGFYVTRDSWSNGKYAMVVGIGGVEEEKMIEGEPPYFNRRFPEDHPKAGKIWKRSVYLRAPWFYDGEYVTESGGTYGWTRVYPTDQEK